MRNAKGKSRNWELSIFLSILFVFSLISAAYANSGQGWNLIQAAYKGHLKVVKTLLAHGADVNAKVDDGLTALSIAKARGHFEIAQMLKRTGARE